MKLVPVTFPCGDIQLEGIWHLPEVASPKPAVVVCHPHPLYGGSMSNNVVVAICEKLAQRSIATLRFNFRGVGNSGGKHGDGIGEQEDVRAAVSLALSTEGIDQEKIGLAGYSFGASVALPVALHDERISLLALVSPALSEAGWEQMKAYTKPVFIISGEHDFVIPPQQLQQYIEDMAEPKQYEIISGADHFWQGFEEEMGNKVAEFFLTGFKPA